MEKYGLWSRFFKTPVWTIPPRVPLRLYQSSNETRESGGSYHCKTYNADGPTGRFKVCPTLGTVDSLESFVFALSSKTGTCEASRHGGGFACGAYSPRGAQGGPGGAEGESRPGDPLAVSTRAAPPLGRPAHCFDISFGQCQHCPTLWEARGREGRPGSDLLGREEPRGGREIGRPTCWAQPRRSEAPGK